jgi:ATP-dependent helicase YprA (DUF1998 family)
MDVFDLQRQVVSDYEKFTRSFTTIRAEDLRAQVEALYADGRFWPEPLIQINPRYKLGRTVAELAETGELHPACPRIFRADGQPLHLFKHQEQSVALAGGGASFVVTTGTGSGKSLCFFIPIVHSVLSERSTGEPRTRAVVVYPMNALANSQMEELEKYLSQAGSPAPITFGRYTGQDDREERQAIADRAPDILLTNFMMLELLLTREDDDCCAGSSKRTRPSSAAGAIRQVPDAARPTLTRAWLSPRSRRCRRRRTRRENTAMP